MKSDKMRIADEISAKQDNIELAILAIRGCLVQRGMSTERADLKVSGAREECQNRVPPLSGEELIKAIAVAVGVHITTIP